MNIYGSCLVVEEDLSCGTWGQAIVSCDVRTIPRPNVNSTTQSPLVRSHYILKMLHFASATPRIEIIIIFEFRVPGPHGRWDSHAHFANSFPVPAFPCDTFPVLPSGIRTLYTTSAGLFVGPRLRRSSQFWVASERRCIVKRSVEVVLYEA